MRISISSLLISMFFIAFITSTQGGNKEPSPKAIDVTMLDNSIQPGTDFFEYVNSKWIKAHPIPTTESRWGAFNLLNENSQNTLREIMQEEAKSNSAKGTIAQKVGDFWYTGMDSASIEKQGIAPLNSYLEMIDDVKTTDDLIRTVTRLQKIGTTAFFQGYVDADQKNSAMNILTLAQGGLGLPDRDYYLRTDPKSEEIKNAYTAYISRIYSMLGAQPAEAENAANTVMRIETELAKSSMTLVEQRNPYSTYNKMSVTDFTSQTPAINWNLYFTSMGYSSMSDLVIAQPEFFQKLNNLISSESINDWKTYLRFHLINNASNLISSDFEKANFDFYSVKLQGVEEMDPRWKRISDLANYTMGEALGQEYVKRTFTPEAKKKMTELVANLKIAFSQRIDQLDWMSAETKLKAKEKLAAIVVKVGYPDKWKDYSSLQLDRGPFVVNVFKSVEFETNRNIAKAGKPVDRTEWGMSPQTVNAYYNPTNNEIVFPAAILQPPFFDPNADNAVNYGGIGAVIGHELTHGFDDQGRLYDAQGNLNDWWTAEDAKKFEAKTANVSRYYSKFNPMDTLHINGDLTNGENIADQGGLAIAYTAFQMAQKKDPQPAKIDGLTAEQRFFINYAQVWRGSARPDALRMQLLTNPHSPGKYRVLGTVSNMPEWYTAFNIKPTDMMFVGIQNQTHIW
ncbi:MAG: M13 family metallopeptidase [Chitinophagales bacterium]